MRATIENITDGVTTWPDTIIVCALILGVAAVVIAMIMKD